jgi:hypothetical protein
MTSMAFLLYPAQETAIPNAINRTRWDFQRQAQAFEPRIDNASLSRGAPVADLMSIFVTPEDLADSNGVYEAVCLFPEDHCKIENGKQRIFSRAAQTAGFSLVGASVEDCLRFTDQQPQLQRALQLHLGGQGGFMENFKPADPQLDTMFTGRAANVELVRNLHTRYNTYLENPRHSDGLNALGVLYVAREFRTAA